MSHRPGFSLAELIIALGMFSALLVASLGFYRQQGRAFNSGNERMTLMQNLRYGVDALEQNLRTAGIGVPVRQPVVVYAGERVFAFNANYATNTQDDLFAVYHEDELASTAVNALTPDRKITLPATSFAYPDSAYSDGGGNSQAETITFFFALDNTTARLDDYALFRQVNDGTAEVIARHLLPTGRPFFSYYLVDPDASGTPVSEVPPSYIPAAHTVPLHGTPADTGIVAAADSIRAVRVSYAATNGLEGERETVRELTRLIRLPNAGIATERTCGNKPLLGTSLVAAGVKATETTPGHVALNWGRAIDEHTGERDVLRYVVWRRPHSTTKWGDPLVSIPAGADAYSYQDFTATVAQKYVYAVAAQDCTPQYSSQAVSNEAEWTY
ncbi:MAG: hypothetical protein KY466_11070 [Gemmatimonadetes bacterium]|nr:hypothetical protein [Gemmatimonadota bacterium]